MLTSRLDRAIPMRIHERTGRALPVRVGTRDLRIPAGVGLRPLARWRPSWKTQVIADQLVRQDGLFLDVGANVGQTLVDHLASGAGGGYLGVEPIVECVAYLKQLVDRNRLDGYGLLPVGLADSPGVLPFYVPPDDSSSATMLEGLRPDRHDVPTWISVHRFDDIADRVLAGRKLALVKIDVEGAELLTLSGMIGTLQEHRPPIMCEVLYAHRDADMQQYEARVRALADFLADLGYTVRPLKKAGDQWSGFKEPVTSFPLRVWTPSTSEDCDYLFTLAR